MTEEPMTGGEPPVVRQWIVKEATPDAKGGAGKAAPVKKDGTASPAAPGQPLASSAALMYPMAKAPATGASTGEATASTPPGPSSMSESCGEPKSDVEGLGQKLSARSGESDLSGHATKAGNSSPSSNLSSGIPKEETLDNEASKENRGHKTPDPFASQSKWGGLTGLDERQAQGGRFLGGPFGRPISLMEDADPEDQRSYKGCFSGLLPMQCLPYSPSKAKSQALNQSTTELAAQMRQSLIFNSAYVRPEDHKIASISQPIRPVNTATPTPFGKKVVNQSNHLNQSIISNSTPEKDSSFIKSPGNEQTSSVLHAMSRSMSQGFKLPSSLSISRTASENNSGGEDSKGSGFICAEVGLEQALNARKEAFLSEEGAINPLLGGTVVEVTEKAPKMTKKQRRMQMRLQQEKALAEAKEYVANLAKKQGELGKFSLMIH